MPRPLTRHASRRRWVPRWIAVVIASCALGGVPLAAQRSASLSGSVRDEAGLPIENALVRLDPSSARQLATTDAKGRFRFGRVASGKHELLVTAIGYAPDVRNVDLTGNGLEIAIVLQRNAALIDTLHIQGRRTGIYGRVLTREQFAALAGAEVKVMGILGEAKTGADGQYEIPGVPPGAHVVQVKRNGYQSRMLSVVVPKDGSVELSLTMDAGKSGEKRLAMTLAEFDGRQRWMQTNHAALIPRQELAGRGGQSLADALRYSMSYLVKGLVLDDAACLYENGIFQSSMTAKDYLVRGIEAVEVYGSGADRTGTVTFSNGFPPTRLPPHGQCGTLEPMMSLSTERGLGSVRARPNPARVEAIVIWLKR